jgi:hypothetical protein
MQFWRVSAKAAGCAKHRVHTVLLREMNAWGRWVKRLLVMLVMSLFVAAGGHAAGFEARVGRPASALQAQDLNGMPHTLSRFRGKGGSA